MTTAHPELGYRITRGVINTLFGIVIAPVAIILAGPLLYALGA